MPNTVYGPYNPTLWIAGVTPGSQDNMRNLELQAAEAWHGFNPDLVGAGYVHSGVQASGTAGTTTVNISSGRAYVIFADGTVGCIVVVSTTQTTSAAGTTYHLWLQNDGSWFWNTGGSPAANSLHIADVTTNGSGQIATIIDTRPQLVQLMPNAQGVSVVLPGNVTATLGGALGAPSTTGMSASAVAGAGMGTGTYKYVVTYAMDGGETLQSAFVSVTTTGGNNQVSLTGIPISADPRVTRRKIYRTAVGGASYTWVKTIGDNSTTTYTDAASDAAIASSVKVPPTRSTLGGNLRSGYPWSTSTPNSAFAGTVTGVTFGQTTMVTGDGTTGALFNGTSDKITFPVTGLPSGNSAWSILAIAKPTNATNTIDEQVVGFGLGSSPGQSAGIVQAAAGGWRAITGQYYDVVQSDFPTSYYRIGEASGTTINDRGSRATNLTLNGGVTLATSGLITNDPGTGATFNGTTGFLNGSGTGLASGTAVCSQEALVKMSANPAGTVVVTYQGGNTIVGNQCFFIQINSSGQASAGNGTVGTTASSALALNVTHHLAAVWDGTNINFYVDGVFIANVAATMALSTTNTTVGASGNGGANFYHRIAQEAAFYNSALSAARILAHSNAVASQSTTTVGTSVAATKHLLAATYDGTTLTMNIDGGASTGTATPTARSLTLTNGRIGDNNNGTAEVDFFPGTIQKVAIFNYALSSQQIALYNTLMGGASGNVTFDQQVLDDGALRYYSLNDAVSATTAAETTRYETVMTADGTIRSAVAPIFDGGIASVGRQATVGSLGVPVIISAQTETNITNTGTNGVGAVVVGATGLYRVSMSVYYSQAGANNLTARVDYTDSHAGATTRYFVTAEDPTRTLNAKSTTGAQAIALVPMVILCQASTSINPKYIDAGGTPADFVSVVIERLS